MGTFFVSEIALSRRFIDACDRELMQATGVARRPDLFNSMNWTVRPWSFKAVIGSFLLLIGMQCMPYVNAADTIHPSQPGHDFLARRFANAVRERVLSVRA